MTKPIDRTGSTAESLHVAVQATTDIANNRSYPELWLIVKPGDTDIRFHITPMIGMEVSTSLSLEQALQFAQVLGEAVEMATKPHTADADQCAKVGGGE